MDTETLIGLQRVASEYPHIMEILEREYEELRPLRDKNQESYELAFQELICSVWKERWTGRKPVCNEEFFWWLSLLMIANFPKSILLMNITAMIETNLDGFFKGLEQGKQDGGLPSNMTPEEVLAAIYDPPKMIIRPGNPYLQSLGVKSTQEWLERGTINHLVRMAELIRTGQIQRVIKAVFWSSHRAFQIQGRAPEGSLSFDEYSEKFSVADIIAGLDTEYTLDQFISATKLSPMETLIVNGWRYGELPLPGRKAKYGQVKSFCAGNNIPYKDLYIIRDRAIAKLKQKGAEMR